MLLHLSHEKAFIYRTALHEIVQEASRKKNIYTYEIRHGSKAYKLLRGKQFNFQHEEVLWKELLIFILSTGQNSKHLDFIKGIEPLEFDVALLGDYLEAMGKDSKKITVTEELDHLFDELDDKKERFEMLELFGNSGCFFDFDDDEESE